MPTQGRNEGRVNTTSAPKIRDTKGYGPFSYEIFDQVLGCCNGPGVVGSATGTGTSDDLPTQTSNTVASQHLVPGAPPVKSEVLSGLLEGVISEFRIATK